MKEELEQVYEDFKVLSPNKLKEEIVLDGCFFTVARITADLSTENRIDGTTIKKIITAEGISKRSGDDEGEPDVPNGLGRVIALGRAKKAMALKLISQSPWMKIHNNLMG